MFLGNEIISVQRVPCRHYDKMKAPSCGDTRWQESNLPRVGVAVLDGDGLGDLGFMKKVRKAVKAPVKLHHKALMKITPKPIRKPLDKAFKKTEKATDKLIDKTAPIVVPVAGVVLAPFTGGASLAAAAVITAGMQMDKAKEKKKKIKEEEKKAKAEAVAAEAAYWKKQDELMAAHGLEYPPGMDPRSQQISEQPAGLTMWNQPPQTLNEQQLVQSQQGYSTPRNSVSSFSAEGGGEFRPNWQSDNGSGNPESSPIDKKALVAGAVVVGSMLLM
ncbi:MAG: hypothetical protein ACPGTP_03700 [Bacteroidia bacterium]